jgi:dTDP-4-dehydrorhamnose reductase
MNIVLIGSEGMLGTDLSSELEKAGHNVHEYDVETINFDTPDSILKLDEITTTITWVVNCAAYTAVDKCETEESLAFQVNSEGPKALARYCDSRNIPLVHFSTDYVFDGKKEGSYIEEDLTGPINIYGHSKLAAEKYIQTLCPNHLIFRVQSLYGKNGNSFVKTMLDLGAGKETISVVSDQKSSPTSTKEVAEWVVLALEKRIPFGLYHLCAEGETNWADFAKEIFALSTTPCEVNDISTKEFSRPAKRPLNGILDTTKLKEATNYTPPHWKEQLKDYIS